MKKIILLVFVSMINLADQKGTLTQVGEGLHYSDSSLEDIYDKKNDSSHLTEKKLKEYFRNGNALGFNVNYNLGARAKRPTIQIKRADNKNNMALLDTTKKKEYKLVEGKDSTIYSYSAIKIIDSGNIILKGNIKSEDELMKQQINRVASILKKNSKRLVNIYGEIKGINVEMNSKNSARYIDSNKVVLYFNKEN